LAVLGLTLAGGALLGAGYGWLRRLKRRNGAAPKQRLARRANRAEEVAIEAGDIVGIRGREYWLRDGYRLTEDGRILARVFELDGAGLVALAGLESEMYFGHAVTLSLPPVWPARIQLEQAIFDRELGYPVQAEAFGAAAGCFSGFWGMYLAASGESLWVLELEGRVTALLAERVDESEFFYWGKVVD
jgi:hypothetical protein